MLANSSRRFPSPPRAGASSLSTTPRTVRSMTFIAAGLISASLVPTGAWASAAVRTQMPVASAQPDHAKQEQDPSVQVSGPATGGRAITRSGHPLVDEDGLLPNGIFANDGITDP